MIYIIDMYSNGHRHLSLHEDLERAQSAYDTMYDLVPLTVRATMRLYEVDLNFARLIASDTT